MVPKSLYSLKCRYYLIYRRTKITLAIALFNWTFFVFLLVSSKQSMQTLYYEKSTVLLIKEYKMILHHIKSSVIQFFRYPNFL